jgi:hypothetical protein
VATPQPEHQLCPQDIRLGLAVLRRLITFFPNFPTLTRQSPGSVVTEILAAGLYLVVVEVLAVE